MRRCYFDMTHPSKYPANLKVFRLLVESWNTLRTVRLVWNYLAIRWKCMLRELKIQATWFWELIMVLHKRTRKLCKFTHYRFVLTNCIIFNVHTYIFSNMPILEPSSPFILFSSISFILCYSLKKYFIKVKRGPIKKPSRRSISRQGFSRNIVKRGGERTMKLKVVRVRAWPHRWFSFACLCPWFTPAGYPV